MKGDGRERPDVEGKQKRVCTVDVLQVEEVFLVFANK